MHLEYPSRIPDSKRKPDKNPVKNKHFHLRAKIVVSIIFVVFVLSFLIAQYCYYVALKLEIDRVQGQIASIQEEKNHLEIEVNSLSSLERIEMIALEELGLKYPEEQQWLVLTSR